MVHSQTRDQTMVSGTVPLGESTAGKREMRDTRETRRKTTANKISGRGRRVRRSNSFDKRDKSSLLYELLIGD